MLTSNKEYPINEYFGSMQEAGSFAGTPAFFIRTQGCNVNCPWCETKQTWSTQSEIGAIKDKKTASEIHEYLSSEILIHLAADYKHIVITGGEPCLYDLTELTTNFFAVDAMVQVETSGTVPILVHPFTWVTLSPNLHNTKLPVLTKSVYRACEFRFHILNESCIKNVEKFLAEYDVADIPIWLQPVSQSESATKLCLDTAREKEWKVNIQVKKFIGLR